MEDIHYNKYIKYKTKYLELKEQRGSGLDVRKWFSKKFNNKIKEEENPVKQIEEKDIFGEIFDELIKQKLLIHRRFHFEKDSLSLQIYLLEIFLFNKILPHLYIYKNTTKYQQNIIIIYKSFCNAINTCHKNTYREEQNIKEIKIFNNELQLSIIIMYLDNIKKEYGIDSPVLKETILMYFSSLDYCINNEIEFYNNNSNICENNNVIFDNILKNPFHNDNGKIKVETLLSPQEKLLYAVYMNS
jgi:hypothetical protein